MSACQRFCMHTIPFIAMQTLRNIRPEFLKEFHPSYTGDPQGGMNPTYNPVHVPCMVGHIPAQTLGVCGAVPIHPGGLCTACGMLKSVITV